MKKYILIIIILCKSFVLFSQSIDYNLRSFKVPETKYQKLDLGFSGYFNSSITTRDQEVYKDLSNNNYLRVSYNLYINTNNLQSETNFFLSGQTWKSRYQSVDYSFDDFDLYLRPNLISKNRYYFNKFFAYGELELKNKYRQNKNNSNRVDIDNQFNINTGIGLGYGRIDQVQDVRLALYILNDLQENGLVQREIQSSDIQALGELISKLKSTRYFDSRLKKIQDMKEIHSFMEENGIIKKGNIDYFNLVNDNWDYAYGPIRERGSRVTFVLYDYFQNYRDIDIENGNSDIDIYSKSLSWYASLDYVYTQPYKLKWQYGFGIDNYLGLGAINYISSNYEYKRSIVTNPFLSIGYYPNTRTSIEGKVGHYFFRYLNENKGYYDFNSSVAVNYYISPKVRLSAIISYSDIEYKFLFRSFDYHRDSKFNANFSFTYSIF